MVLAHDSSLAPAGLLTSALDGRDGPDAVRLIVTSPLEHGVAELLEAALPSARPRSLQLLRSKIWPAVPKKQFGRRLTRTQEDAILGYGPDGV